ncbi:MAG: ACP phosphodiesterase [Saprospiraceae bacterium]
MYLLQSELNFLAHIALSQKNPPWMVGNFLADFLKPSETVDLPEDIIQGIKIHQNIDAFTDHHPDVKKSILRMSHYQGKYAPVVIDICFDFFLCKYWDLYYIDRLEVFIDDSYKVFQDYHKYFPQSFQAMFERMIKFDFLNSSMNKDRLVANFIKLQTRVKFENQLPNAVDHLFLNLYEYETEFLNFYPDLIKSTDEFILKNYVEI